MKKRILVLVSIASASCLAAFVAACGDDSSNVDGGGGDATTDVASGNDATNDTGPVTDSATDSPASDAGANPCVGADGGCRACCDKGHPDAAALLILTLESCACTNPGACASQAICGKTLCALKAPSTTCAACLADPDSGTDAGSCIQVAKNACDTDNDCKALEACTAACPADGG